ncbi:MAG: hypothetical protein HY912_02615 [Desulfomonile tiedjei]|uniref:Uncharacterized protein n=1 Tax=Desulfomonile tiedjei TaxID=2358 RepID=A0A9D6UXZ2_9BACT|nr:hypothetical protein [Desulfomonile tiedjei]
MVKRVVSAFLCIVMLTSVSLSLAGGPPAPPVPPGCYPAKPCGPTGPGGPSSSYWGDAPIPGLCGGIIALPFLVCGSLLGGNTGGAYAPAYGPGYAPVSYPAKYVAPVAPVRYAPAYPQACAPAYPPACAPAPMPCGPGYGQPAGGGMFSGLPCLDLCASLLGFGGGTGLFY